MTYIEFFDKTATENICSCLTYTPDRVILIGDNSKKLNRHIKYYQQMFEERNQHIEFIPQPIPRGNLNAAVEALSALVEKYDDCIFDITGGEETYILALGMVCEKYAHRGIQVHKINLHNNAIYDCDKDGITVEKKAPFLSVKENVRIYGGDVVFGDVDEEKTYKWELDKDFRRDVDMIWNICKNDVRYWNVQIGIFDAIRQMGKTSEDGLTVTAKRGAVENYLSQHRTKYKISKGILNYLTDNGLITEFDDETDTIVVSFKNKQVKKCLTKAGMALEMKVFIGAVDVKDKDGNAVYDDALNGVVIDWDGELHDEEKGEGYDTENEIDVLLMHDAIPVFISCKNGIVTSEELYKLNTVAERFGGKYARKVLCATALDLIGESGEYLRARAKDMDIRVIDDILELDDEGFLKRLRNLWN